MGFFTSSTTNHKKGSSFFSDDPYSTDKLQQQIENAQVRIDDSGYKPQDADRRNWFERVTNLPQGQNWFFDTLEILGRGGNAIRNVIDKKDQEDAGTAFFRGLSGKEKVSGSDLAEKAGVTNKVGKFLLGTGIDIVSDPTTYIPGGVIAKGIKSSAGMAVKPLKSALSAVEDAAPAVRTFRQTQIAPRLESVKDGLGYMFKPGYKQDETLFGEKSDFLQKLQQDTENSRRFTKDEYLNNLTNTAKDTGVESGTDVGRIMEQPLRQFTDVKGYEFPDGLRTTNKDELKSSIELTRERLKSSGKEVNAVGRDYKKIIQQATSELAKTNERLRSEYFKRENSSLRQLTKKKNQPVNIEEIAQNQAFSDVSVSPKFNYLLKRRDELKTQLETLKQESQVAKADKLQAVNSNLEELQTLKQSLRNPVMIQKEIDRPVRDIPSDPKIQQAAKTLIDSNNEIRQLAAEKGIQLPELEGYMSHILSTEERDLRKINKPKSIDAGSFNTGNPNKSFLQQRKYMGSVEDINEKAGRKIFEPNAYFATAIGQQRLIDYIHAVDFRKQVLTHPDFARPYVKGMDIPKNAEVIDSNNYTFLKDTGDSLDGIVQPEQIGGKYIVTKAAKQLLDRYQRINTDEGTKAFIKAIGGIQGTWKKLALFSPGFHIRNVAGAGWNMYAAGMNPADIATYATKSVNDLAKVGKGAEIPLYQEFRKQGLASGGLTQSEYSSFFKEPEKVIEKQVKDKSQPIQKRLVSSVMPQNIFNTSRNIGEKSDEAMKYAMYQWAREKLKLDPSAAAAKVKEALFDYSDLTPFEQKARMLIPFYSWSRKNIPFQVKKLIEDPRKFANLNKIRLNAQSAVGIDEQNQPDYMKENLAIPVYGSEGKGKMLGLNLPASDLTKLSNPLKLFADGITPLLKTPLEYYGNYNFFRGKPIQKFEGQEKKYQIPGTNIGFGIPVKTAYALEQATGQVGRNATEYLQKPDNVDQDTKFRAPSFGMSSVVKDFDAAKNAYYEKLQELKQLQDLMLYIQQQEGEKPRTVSEIKKGSK